MDILGPVEDATGGTWNNKLLYEGNNIFEWLGFFFFPMTKKIDLTAIV